jgi:hypothetical protein
MSGLRTRVMAGASSGLAGSCVFLIFEAAYCAGRKSATAAAMTTTSASSATSITASRSSRAVLTGMTLTPSGGTSEVFAETRRTSAPRRAATAASA